MGQKTCAAVFYYQVLASVGFRLYVDGELPVPFFGRDTTTKLRSLLISFFYLLCLVYLEWGCCSPSLPNARSLFGRHRTKKLSRQQLLAALRDAAAIFYNSSKVKCYDTHGSANNATETDALLWDYLFCSGILQPSSRNGKSDSMLPRLFSASQFLAILV